MRRFILTSSPGEPTHGVLRADGLTMPCALGRGGIIIRKREGDGGTPTGQLGLVRVFYRADRLPPPRTALPLTAIRPDDGWCDDPDDPNYNRLVRLPARAHHERLWRDDHLYDLMVVLDYNLACPKRGAGSAIFLHLAAPGYAPTEGCVAVSLPSMRHILARAMPGAFLDIR